MSLKNILEITSDLWLTGTPFSWSYYMDSILPTSSSVGGMLVLSFGIYVIGLIGIIANRKNFLVTMMCVELMYLGVITSFAFYGVAANDFTAQVFALILLVLAACESAIGLGLLIAMYRFGRKVDFESYQQLGG